MLISEFDYHLPENLIAQNPLDKREASRMLIVNRSEADFRDAHFYRLPQFLKKGDVLVLNNTKVFPARLFGTSETGAKVEVFLAREIENLIWETLARPARRLKIGRKIVFDKNFSAEVISRTAEGRIIVRLTADGNFEELLESVGSTPLPPYIRREAGITEADKNSAEPSPRRPPGCISRRKFCRKSRRSAWKSRR